MNEKVRVAKLSVISNSFLIIMKVVAGVLSGSISIISEAIHSFMDLLASIIAYFSVKISDNPPDERHPYGHGKIENISGVIEAILILLAAFWIIFEAVKKIVSPVEIESLGIGSMVMLISAGVNFIVSRKLYITAKKTDSVALEADALHLKTDVYTSLGVGIGLLLIWITGYHFLDPIIAVLVALLIIGESYNLMKKAFYPLVDTALDKSEIIAISKKLDELNVLFHDMKTRKSGKYKFVDIHIELPGNMKLEEAHEYCDKIEREMEICDPVLKMNIHIEPENYHIY